MIIIRKRFVLLVSVAAVNIGCSQSDLTREHAKKVLDDIGYHHAEHFSVPVGCVNAEDRSTYSSKLDVAISAGLVRYSQSASVTYRRRNQPASVGGIDFSVAANPGATCEHEYSPLISEGDLRLGAEVAMRKLDDGRTFMSVPTLVPGEVQILGIKPPGENTRVVEYAIDWREIQPAHSQLRSIWVDSSDGGLQTYSAVFERFDDGWRLTDRAILQRYGIASFAGDPDPSIWHRVQGLFGKRKAPSISDD